MHPWITENICNMLFSSSIQTTWHCSICKRRLLSKSRPSDPPPQDVTVARLPTKATTPTPALPTPGKPSALTLMTGIASVASSFAGTQAQQQQQQAMLQQQQPQQQQQSSMAQSQQSSLLQYQAPQPVTTLQTFQHQNRMSAVTAPSTAPASVGTPTTVSASSSLGVTSALAYGNRLDGRRPSMSYVPPAILTETPKPQPVDMPKKTPAKTPDFSTTQNTSGEKVPSAKIEPEHNEQAKLSKNTPESEGSSSPRDLHRSTSQMSVESSGDETRYEAGRRGRRRSIVRQQSYEEDLETQTNSLLPLWGGGSQLPVRRHSAQGPARRDEALEAARKARDSLDVPSRAQRHHSCDYDLQNPNLLLTA